jgi:hypothetical protein
MIEHKLYGIQHTPRDIFRRLAAVGRVRFQVVDQRPAFFFRGEPAVERQVQLVSQCAVVTEAGGQPRNSFSWSSGEFRACSTWATLGSFARSHSQAVVRVGRPKSFKK